VELCFLQEKTTLNVAAPDFAVELAEEKAKPNLS